MKTVEVNEHQAEIIEHLKDKENVGLYRCYLCDAYQAIADVQTGVVPDEKSIGNVFAALSVLNDILRKFDL